MKKLIALFVLVVFSFPSFAFAADEGEVKDMLEYVTSIHRKIDVVWLLRDEVCLEPEKSEAHSSPFCQKQCLRVLRYEVERESLKKTHSL